MEKKIFIEDNIGFVELLDAFGDDLTVVNAARVSSDKESHLEAVSDPDGNIVGYQVSERDKTLINHLTDHQHINPFFHPILRFRIKMPLFIARQWFKHTVGFARSEISRRHVNQGPEFFIPQTLRQESTKNESVPNNAELITKLQAYHQHALTFYQELLAQDVTLDQARTVMPQSTYTEFIETASLSAYARLVHIRTGNGVIKETRNYAEIISKLIEPAFPVSWAALIKPQEGE